MAAVNEEIKSPRLIKQENQRFTSFTPNKVYAIDKERKQLATVSNVVIDSHHTLDLPENYKGSKMFMPMGQRLYWQAEVIPPPHGPATCQDFEEIRARCLSEGVLFEDPEFPTEDKSLLPKEESNGIKWLRPGDLVKNPKLCVKSYSRFDVRQGQLGDCWLAAAIATLTTQKKLFDQVVSTDQSFEEDYAGVFHFRFWQYGRWVDVVIDDLLPTRYGELVFMSSSAENEFWSPLLEKAYAKLHGSYGALPVGYAADALEDFTGGLAEIYNISDLTEDFFKHLHKAHARKSLLCADILDEVDDSCGLVGGHTYSVTGVKQLDGESILRIRNPWGTSEWTGAWSDESPKWKLIPQKKKKALGLNENDDGEFWMHFMDFTKYFKSVTICSLNPNFLYPEDNSDECSKKWKMSMFEGKWVKDETASGNPDLESHWRNPQYTITVTYPDEEDDEDICTVIISLTQKYSRTKLKTTILEIGFHVYRVEDDDAYGHLEAKFFEENEPVNESMGYEEVTAHLELSPGRYVIVPSTSKPDQEGEFLLRVLTEKSHDMCAYRRKQ